MSLHGLREVTVGVPRVEDVAGFYREFGLAESAGAVFATTDGGDQLRLVSRPVRRLEACTVAADDADDVARVRAQAETAGVAATAGDTTTVVDPVGGAAFTVAVAPRLDQPSRPAAVMNAPGTTARAGERAHGIFADGPTSPRRLGHVMLGTPDLDASLRFYTEVLGFKLSDSVPGLIAFLRCSSDHHNVGLMQAPVAFLHHTSWQVDDLDAIGQGAQHLMAVDAERSVWGLGRHFLGSNLFWYFRDPAGNFAEYFADLDQIVDDDVWVARTWEPDKSLYAWGPPVPPEFIAPPDLFDIQAAVADR
jgi:catechol 2,3-dioxygenase-like lactoylglutathione lyase family enzyme